MKQEEENEVNRKRDNRSICVDRNVAERLNVRKEDFRMPVEAQADSIIEDVTRFPAHKFRHACVTFWQD